VIERGTLKFVAVHGGSPPTWAPVYQQEPAPEVVATQPAPPPPPTLAEVRARSVALVQEEAAARHTLLIPDAPIVHDRKRREAREVIDNASPDAASYPMLASMITGTPTKEAFDAVAILVLQREQDWAQKAPQIERTKAEAIHNIMSAESIDRIQAVINSVQWP
jgi:hypothetical protein